MWGLGYSPVVVRGLLTVMPPLVVAQAPEHWLLELWHGGLVALRQVGSHFPDQESNLALVGKFLTMEPPGKSQEGVNATHSVE